MKSFSLYLFSSNQAGRDGLLKVDFLVEELPGVELFDPKWLQEVVLVENQMLTGEPKESLSFAVESTLEPSPEFNDEVKRVNQEWAFRQRVDSAKSLSEILL